MLVIHQVKRAPLDLSISIGQSKKSKHQAFATSIVMGTKQCDKYWGERAHDIFHSLKITYSP